MLTVAHVNSSYIQASPAPWLLPLEKGDPLESSCAWHGFPCKAMRVASPMGQMTADQAAFESEDLIEGID